SFFRVQAGYFGDLEGPRQAAEVGHEGVQVRHAGLFARRALEHGETAAAFGHEIAHGERVRPALRYLPAVGELRSLHPPAVRLGRVIPDLDAGHVGVRLVPGDHGFECAEQAVAAHGDLDQHVAERLQLEELAVRHVPRGNARPDAAVIHDRHVGPDLRPLGVGNEVTERVVAVLLFQRELELAHRPGRQLVGLAAVPLDQPRDFGVRLDAVGPYRHDPRLGLPFAVRAAPEIHHGHAAAEGAGVDHGNALLDGVERHVRVPGGDEVNRSGVERRHRVEHLAVTGGVAESALVRDDDHEIRTVRTNVRKRAAD